MAEEMVTVKKTTYCAYCGKVLKEAFNVEMTLTRFNELEDTQSGRVFSSGGVGEEKYFWSDDNHQCDGCPEEEIEPF